MVSNEIAAVKQRAKALNERLRALLRTMMAIERDDPEFSQEMRHYGIIAEFAATLVARLGYE